MRSHRYGLWAGLGPVRIFSGHRRGGGPSVWSYRDCLFIHWSRFLGGQVLYSRVRGIPLYGLDTVLAGWLGIVHLTGGDDLPVALGAEVEIELTVAALLDLESWKCHGLLCYGLLPQT